MKKKLIITRKWPEAVEQALTEKYDCIFNQHDTPFSPTQLQHALQTADALLTTVTDTLDARVLSIDNPRCRIIGNFGVGYSHIDTAVAKEQGITVTNTPDVLSDCTADIAMTLLLMAARRAGEGERELRAKRWTGWRPTHLIGSKVSGKTLGIIGFGRIGRAMAHRAHHGFGMPIKVYNRSTVNEAALAPVKAEQLNGVEEILATSDFVSLHCPGGNENKHLINANNLKHMRKSSYLINTARGEVIDEEALIDALHNKRIAGVGLDVFNNEPDLDPRFLTLDNAALLPHLGSATIETRDDMGFRVATNLDQFFAGESPQDQVT